MWRRHMGGTTSAEAKMPNDTATDKRKKCLEHLSEITQDILSDDLDQLQPYLDNLRFAIDECIEEDMLLEGLSELSIVVNDIGGSYSIHRKIQSFANFIFDNVPRIVLLGETGSGKSTLANIFLQGSSYGSELFKTSAVIDSVTSTPACKQGKWLGREQQVKVVDSPGFNDSNNNDCEHVKNIVKELKTLEYITAFVLVLNSEEPRLTQSQRKMISGLKKIFNNRFLNNLLVFFTRWSVDTESVIRRGDVSRESKVTDINKVLRTELDTDKDIPCFFIDSIEYIGNIGDKGWIHSNALQEFMEHVMSMSKYNVSDINSSFESDIKI